MKLTTNKIATLLPAAGILLLGAAPLFGCGPTVFQGQTGLAIVGDLPALPAPPPPPPPPPKVEKAPQRVQIVDNKIVINEKIQFELAKANILPESHSLLDELVKTLKDNPHVKQVRVEGYASSEGPDAFNLNLSDMRAKAVMAYFTAKGVDAGRLEAKGFGEADPIADNETEQGREKNRRVEFKIINQDVTKKKVPIVDGAAKKEGK
jgi:outer membrane protein OmpA-like peptidoglycan-associated protein